MVPQGSGWTLEGSSMSPYASYASRPLMGGFPTTPAAQGVQSHFWGWSYSHLVPPGSNPVSPKASMVAGHGAGTGVPFGTGESMSFCEFGAAAWVNVGWWYGIVRGNKKD